MLEHVDLCLGCARELFPLLEAPMIREIEMGYVARLVARCERCKRHVPAILAAQRRFDRERARHHCWHVFDEATGQPSSTKLALRTSEDWAWVERV